ncbi:aromatic ring-hydroxylating dioxygenase subunit alpha [Ramlibacter henchirensis]|uniref:Aromatic ring-hydroxylating dioxygenase subunit alpha n=1 Tax=Ramlibacter henchirensis TaxID=204072 RepID=A0A4Z0C6F5_9BURK|nr:aromatic ring-hydroxylating dioxygenase subunit alpha [Ramlibacter henchirensis]TFZ05679.1 aromatic ring-hydroxylating dioxygenase subunit alpha [Ramlibacter henchirensis]
MFILNTWYIAAWGSEIREKPMGRRICNQPIVFFRDHATGKVAALEDRCCHRAAPLSMGVVVESGLQCGYHGVVHDCSGRCVHIPGQEKIPTRAKVRAYPVVEKNEFVWIWMGAPELADESKIVDYPFNDDHANWPHEQGFYHIKANYLLMVDNLMDLTHLGYVHGSTIGGNPRTHVEALMDVNKTEDSLSYVRWMLNSVPPPTYLAAVPFKGRVDRWQEFEFVAPSNVLQWSGAVDAGTGAREHGNRSGGFSLRIFHGLTPETESSCFYFYAPANGYRQDDPVATKELMEHISKAFLEDKLICEGQQERIAELGEKGLIDIVSDVSRIHLRRIVQRMADRERAQHESAPSEKAAGAQEKAAIPEATAAAS